MDLKLPCLTLEQDVLGTSKQQKSPAAWLQPGLTRNWILGISQSFGLYPHLSAQAPAQLHAVQQQKQHIAGLFLRSVIASKRIQTICKSQPSNFAPTYLGMWKTYNSFFRMSLKQWKMPRICLSAWPLRKNDLCLLFDICSGCWLGSDE
jgi:hypothetical protein